MDILGALPRTTDGNVSRIMLAERHSKTTTQFPKLKKTALHVANVLLNHWIVPYGKADHLYLENDLQFVGKFVATL